MNTKERVEAQLARWIATRSDRHYEQSAQELVAAEFAELGKFPLEIPTLTSFDATESELDIVEAQLDDVTRVPNLVFPASEYADTRVAVMFNVDTSPVGESFLEAATTIAVERDGTVVRGWGGLKSNSVAILQGITRFVDDVGEYPFWLEVSSVVEEELTGHGAISVIDSRPRPNVAFVSSPLGEVNCGGHCGVVRVGVTLDSKPPSDSDRSRILTAVDEFLESQAAHYQSSLGAGVEAAGVRVLPTARDREFIVRIGLPYGLEPRHATHDLLKFLQNAFPKHAPAITMSGLHGKGFATVRSAATDFTSAWRTVTNIDVPTEPFLAAGDSRHYNRIDVPVTSFGNRIQHLHTKSEFVSVDDVDVAADVFRAKLHELHGHIANGTLT